MKVAFIVQDLCGQGAQASTAAIIRGLVHKGYQVDILNSQIHHEKLEKGDYAFPLPPTVKEIWMPSRRARGNILFLRHYLKTTDADIVISTGDSYSVCHRIAMFGLRRPIRHVMVDHGNWYEWSGKWFGWLAYTWFDRHLFVNSRARDIFLKHFPYYPRTKTHVVYNTAVDDLFWQKLAKSATHPWLVDKKCFTFVTAGAFCDSKRHMDLLRAVNEVKDRVRVRLILFGKGPLEAQYRAYIREHGLEDLVSVGGFSNDLPAEMKAADGYLMASDRESFGIVIVEALACGLPVISTDALYGPREILADGKYGVIVPVGDYKAMAAEMLKLATGPKKHVPQDAWSRFTAEAAVEYFEKGIL